MLQPETGVRVIARTKREATKSDHMSFAKGDEIEVVEAEGKWHKGILRESSKYKITGEVLKYPANFVKPKI